MGHHDDDTPKALGRSPANRLGLDYRDAVPLDVPPPVIDVHTHVYDVRTTPDFFESARLYGVDVIVSMTPLDEVDTLRSQYADRLEFIAIPRWRDMEKTAAFQKRWLDDLAAFREKGARRMKFWMAPPMRGRFGVTLKDSFFTPVINEALDLGYEFMIHVGDPSPWFESGGRYADRDTFGTKRDHYPQLEYLLETVAPRSVIAAHFGGYIEDPDFLQNLLDRYPNLLLDSSATKWVIRGVAKQPEILREFIIRNADRILFGSDLVIAGNYDFEHYASRYWAHHKMWATAYRGESPIDDPDAGNPPKLVGLELPPDVLRKLYSENARRVGHGSPLTDSKPDAQRQGQNV